MSLARQRELVVLALLHGHPMHGYALAEVLEEGLGPAVGLQRPTIYAILKRFEERGWIAGEEEQEGARPPRSVFHLTATGRAALPGLATSCASASVDSPLPLAAVIAHLDLLPDGERRAVIARHREDRAARMVALAPVVDHPGLLGVAFGLMRDQLALELAALDGLVEDGGD